MSLYAQFQAETGGVNAGTVTAPSGALPAAPKASPLYQQFLDETSPTPSALPKPTQASGYSPASETDVSGRPFATVPVTIPKTFMSPETTISQVDKTRVAPSFDPTKPQHISRTMLHNGRMPESASQQIKSQLGGTAAQELDHIMPLELGGSNDKMNLRLESLVPGTKNTPTDPIENQIAQSAMRGDISALDAWRQMAKAKGITLAEDKYKNNPVNQYLLEHPRTLEPLASAQEAITGAANSVGGYVKSLVTNPIQTIKNTAGAVGKELGLNAIAHPLDTLKTIGENAVNDTKGTVNNFLNSAKTIGEDLKTGQSTQTQKTANVLNMLTSAASLAFLPVSEAFNVASQLPVIKPAADAIGLTFDASGKVAGFAADTLFDALPISAEQKNQLAGAVHNAATLAGQIVLGGYIYGKVMGGTSPEEVLKDANVKAEEMNKESLPPEAKPEAPKIEQAQPTEVPKPTEAPQAQNNLEGAKVAPTAGNIPKELQPLAEEARKYKSAEEFVNGLNNDVNIARHKSGDIFITKTQESLPPVKDGYIRLFRAEGGERGYNETFSKTNIAPIAKDFAEGDTKYYTPKLVDAAVYADEYKAPIKYIDIPKNLATKVNDSEYLVSKSQLTDFYNKATGNITAPPETTNTEQKALPAPEETPKSALPKPRLLRPVKSSGEETLLGSSKNIFAAAKARGMEVGNVEDLPTYNKASHAKLDVRITDMMKNDPARAERIALGEEKAPEGDIAQRYFQAHVLKANVEGDGSLAQRLAQSRMATENTAIAQKLGALRGVGTEDAVSAIKEINDAWKKAVQEKTKQSTGKAMGNLMEKAKNIAERAKVARPKINWNDFLDTIKC